MMKMIIKWNMCVELSSNKEMNTMLIDTEM